MTQALRLRLLAGAAVVACLPGLAAAQTATPRQPDVQPTAGGLTPGALYIEADSAGRVGDVISATGETERVFARY
ncbi:MAG: hypothetical protein K2X61_12405, partial [Caulobacteraceae bacterium]|nr:hypothetical protein [Caulobacteraceae bacterium]